MWQCYHVRVSLSIEKNLSDKPLCVAYLLLSDN